MREPSSSSWFVSARQYAAGSVRDVWVTTVVDLATGELMTGEDAPQSRAIDVRFEGENGRGDGLQREWFDGIVSEMFDPAR